MYVVSEVTGKKYATMEEAVKDEEKVLKQRKADEDMKKLDDAWDEIINAISHFASIANEYEPTLVAELKPLIEMMKSTR